VDFRRNLPVFLATIVAAAIIFFAIRLHTGPIKRLVVLTAGEVQAVHADVKIKGRAIQGVARLAVGDVVETSDDGRGRLRLDDGTTLVLDRSTRLTVRADAVQIERGRAFVQGVAGTRATVEAGGGAVVLADALVAVTASGAGAQFYCASGEAVVRKGDEKRVRSGETATVGAEGVKVAPEKAFNDWTGGMATPWSATGKPRASIGELWGKLSNVADSGGSPLAIRQHEVIARIEGETATTRVSTTYFNAGDSAVTGDFRMAIPNGGLVSRFAVQSKGGTTEGRLGIARDDSDFDPAKLEWAGDGWVRGTTPGIDPGATLTVIVEYVEWLSPVEGRLSYRYPMVGDGRAPIIGEFRAKIDTSYANPVAIHAGQGATVAGAVVELTRADFRPTSDLVVELELQPNALGASRGYVARPSSGDTGGSYLLVRTEVPAAKVSPGVTLALVVDTSLSVDPALLDAERALVEAVLEGLGAGDRAVVYAADQGLRPVGPPALGPVTPERRKATREALAALRPGGATDLGAALEKAADALPPDAPEGMVIYVGDGWPTVGDVEVDAVRARLARRAGGVPRLGAIAVGPLANRFGLTALVRGSGPVFDIADRADAAEIAVHLLAEALKPAVAGVELDLGPDVERVYPRGSRTILAGGTVQAIGRVRGNMPRTVKVRFRKGATMTEENRNLHLPPVADEQDVRRRWGAARVEELALRGEGREAAIDAAMRVQLMTPWTGWVLSGNTMAYKPAPIEARVLDLAAMRNAPLSARFATPLTSFGTLIGPPSEPEADPKDDEDEFKRAIALAARRTLDEAMGGVRACRDSRAALRPEISGNLRVRATLDGDGRPKKVSVSAASSGDDDPALDRCVEVIVTNLSFFQSGLRTEIVVEHELRLPPPRQVRGHSCSPTSTLPLPVRRGVWRERLRRVTKTGTAATSAVYLQAKESCELPTWTDRRALLELVLDAVTIGPERVAVARGIDDAGDADAAALLRKEAIRRVTTPEELDGVRLALLGDERKATGTFRKAYREAKTDELRLGVVRRFLKLAPHDSGLRRRLFALLEALGQKDPLIDEIYRARQDPFADAALLADGASALRRLGNEDEARRAFGELIERAPFDPYARAYVGDRLRNEHLFEDATAAYDALAVFRPDDPAATLRLGLAHAGAGRLDVASRIFHRVAQTGGRLSDERMGNLASLVEAVLSTAARQAPGRTPDEAARLLRRVLEIPLPDAAALVLVRIPTLDTAVEARLLRGEKLDQEAQPEVSAASLGLYFLRVERGDRAVKLRLRRPAELDPSRPVKAELSVYVRSDDPGQARLVTREVELRADGKPVDLRWDGTTLN
jgi:tetratricopeptide (TPR) repeat protein